MPISFVKKKRKESSTNIGKPPTQAKRFQIPWCFYLEEVTYVTVPNLNQIIIPSEVVPPALDIHKA